MGGFSLVDAVCCSCFIRLFSLARLSFCEQLSHDVFCLLGYNRGKPSEVCCHHHREWAPGWNSSSASPRSAPASSPCIFVGYNLQARHLVGCLQSAMCFQEQASQMLMNQYPARHQHHSKKTSPAHSTRLPRPATPTTAAPLKPGSW